MIGGIIPTFPSTVTVTRYTSATTFVNGLAEVVTSTSTLTIRDCCVQPLQPRERELLPELIRDRETVKVYTQTELRSVDVEGKAKADRVTYQGQRYIVQSIMDWYGHGSYFKVLLMKEDD